MRLQLQGKVEPGAPRFDGARMRGLRAVEGDALCERWLAVDGRGRAITLLRLREEHARDLSVRDAWLAQAAHNQALAVPALLPVLDHGLHGARACASLARADDALPLSMLLAHLAARGERASVALALHVIDGLATGLSAAHARDCADRRMALAHGDLCAERVLVRADGRVQMTELGLWSVLPPALGVRLRSLRGVPEHLPPERTRGVLADAPGDVYALGVLLRRMLGIGVRSRAETGSGVAPEARALAVLLGEMLAVSPDARIAHVDALRERLAWFPRHAAGEPALAQLHADARLQRAPSRPTRHAASRATALIVGLREPSSEALTRPREVVCAHRELRCGGAAAAITQPPLLDEPAQVRLTPAPELSPRLVAHTEPDPAPSFGSYLEPNDSVFQVPKHSRAHAFAAHASNAGLPTRIAMTLAALLLVAALCLLSALLA